MPGICDLHVPGISYLRELAILACRACAILTLTASAADIDLDVFFINTFITVLNIIAVRDVIVVSDHAAARDVIKDDVAVGDVIIFCYHHELHLYIAAMYLYIL